MARPHPVAGIAAPPAMEPAGEAGGETVSEADRGTRQRVLTSILSHGPSTAADLGERLVLTPAAIRRHLAALSEAGLVTSREQRVYGQRGRGRPAKVFLLTEAGRASFPQAYEELAADAIDMLVAASGAPALERLAERRVTDIEQAWGCRARQEPAQSGVERLAGALNDCGYVTSIEPVASGRQLVQHHCPVAGIAARHPVLCEVETRLLGRLLDTHVQRLATIAHGEPVCTTHVPAAPRDELAAPASRLSADAPSQSTGARALTHPPAEKEPQK